jgi:hypothetical protein
MWRRGAGGATGVSAQEAGAQRCDIAAEHDGISGHMSAIDECDAGCASVACVNAADVGVVMECGAVLDCETCQRLSNPMHAAGDAPDAHALNMGDQHQGGWREKWRSPTVGGVAAEHLAQTRVFEVIAK